MSLKIIDTHMHFAYNPRFDSLAVDSGHVNQLVNIQRDMKEIGVVAAVAMARAQTTQDGSWPMGALEEYLEGGKRPDNIYVTTGVQPDMIQKSNIDLLLQRFEENLRQPETVGMKIYAGYQKHYVADEVYRPFIELVTKYGLPVIIHTGETARAEGLLKYSHPLTIDDAAVQYPDTTFVMAHFGFPFVAEAAEVLRKNPNVYADLSGILVGRPDLKNLIDGSHGFFAYLKSWIWYCNSPEKFMFATDWPLASITTYIDFVRFLFDEQHHEKVFYHNAKNVFRRIKE